jgi:hypothetical protein
VRVMKAARRAGRLEALRVAASQLFAPNSA